MPHARVGGREGGVFRIGLLTITNLFWSELNEINNLVSNRLGKLSKLCYIGNLRSKFWYQ